MFYVISTTIPTTISITIPSTILTTIPTTIFITIPTTIPATTPTTLPTVIPSTILTTIPTTIITTISEVFNPTTIITTYIETDNLTTIPTTIISTMLNSQTEEASDYLHNVKCDISSPQSAKYDLCITCNERQYYFEAEFPKNDFLHGFRECYNNISKPINFYFDSSANKYKPCYETCLTCKEGGNGENNNCITCDVNFRKPPDNPDSNNCVTDCFYYYYINSYGQYKCTNNLNCPEEANLFVKELKKCTYDCSKEQKYQYQYGGQCLEQCPNDTLPDENNICKDEDPDACSKSQIEINLQEFLSSGGVDTTAKNYAKEFSYTNKHVSQYYNSIYSILLYKDVTCFEELDLDMAKIDFGNCYTKLQNNLDPPSDQELVIALIERANGTKKTNSYFFYHPITGEKLNTTICDDEQIVIKGSVISQLNNTDVNLNSILYLAQQDINIFNLSDAFYNDICYHFDSPNGKDVPLSDRIKAYYPNVTFCDSGCISKGVNLSSMESICECKYTNDLYNNEVIEGNAFLKNTIGEITEILSSSNLLVLKCYKNVFKTENIIKGSGGFIVLTIFLCQLIFEFIFFLLDMSMIRKYVYNLSEHFLRYISKEENEIGKKSSVPTKNKPSVPPKRKKSKTKILKIGKSNDFREQNRMNNMQLEENIYMNGNTIKSEFRSESKLMSERRKTTRKNSSKIFRKKKNYNVYKDKTIKFNSENIDIEEYLKPDLDEMDYEDALKYDKREFCEYFVENLKEHHTIMDTFFNKDNLRPMSIKIILLLLNIDLYFVINGFFYNEEYISQLFNSEEEETFFSFLPRSIGRFFYSILVGSFIKIIIGCIFIEEKRIKRIFEREKDNSIGLRYEISLLINSIKKRYTMFMIICFFILLFSWYYISCFNNTYPGVKIEWIKSSIAIIIIMQIFSIFVSLLHAILRSLSFYYKSEKLYKLKQLIS